MTNKSKVDEMIENIWSILGKSPVYRSAQTEPQQAELKSAIRQELQDVASRAVEMARESKNTIADCYCYPNCSCPPKYESADEILAELGLSDKEGEG